jgi:hypothetical protein
MLNPTLKKCLILAGKIVAAFLIMAAVLNLNLFPVRLAY